MKTAQVNLRLEADLINGLEAAARAESLERGTMMRKLLVEGLSLWRLQHALRRYQMGEISIGLASEESGRSHWELIELAQAHGIAYRIDVEDSISRARQLIARRRDRVAERAPGYSAGPHERALAQADDASMDEAGTVEPSGAAAGRPRRLGRGPRRSNRPSPGASEASLRDFAPRSGGVLVVGINPAPPSADRGHYYQGRLGRRLWKRLESVGLLAGAVPGQEDQALAAAGHGLTDIVKRVTERATDLTKAELEAGSQRLRVKVREWQPGLVLFVFKQAAVHALGAHDLSPGPCGEISGVPAFLLSGPYASRVVTRRVDAELIRLIRGLAPRSNDP